MKKLPTMKRFIRAFFLTFFIFSYSFVLAQNEFITSWNMGANETLYINVPSGYTYDYTVDWGDGTTTSGVTGSTEHTYTDASLKIVSISGQFPAFQFYNGPNNSASKLSSVEQWGNQVWQSMEGAFQNCNNLTSMPITNEPNLSQVVSMESMFTNATNFDANLSNWDVSNVSNMAFMFDNASNFNGDISTWDVSNVTDMSQMFSFAATFNQDITNWNVSNVTTMESMFVGAELFHQDINNWDVSNVTSMFAMFAFAQSFNDALANWDISSVTTMENMFAASGLSPENYDATLIGWSTLEAGETQIPSNILFEAGNSQFCIAESEKLILETTYNWTITDSGLDPLCGTSPFITTWELDVNQTLTLVINVPSGFTYNYTVDWGDGTVTTGNTASANHTYLASGTKTVRISGQFPAFQIDDGNNAANDLRTIEQWGDQVWQSMENAFDGCESMTFAEDIDTPDLSAVTSMRNMFRQCNAFNSDLNTWDVSNVQDMSSLFNEATAFNGDVSTWDVSNVIDMTSVFARAEMFNGDITGWDTSNVQEMNNMFFDAQAFNQNISGWDTGNVVDMGSMFYSASSFNQDIGNWNTQSLVLVDLMFAEAVLFNQSLGNWDISNVTTMESMFNSTELTPEKYDDTLIGWATLDTGETQIPSNIDFSAGLSKYCTGETARTLLENTFNWDITDAGLDPLCGTSPFITRWDMAGNETTYINVPSGFTYNYTVDWGDGTIDTGITGDTNHTYTTGGIKTVRITGQFPAFSFANGSDENAFDLISVERWGDQVWETMEEAFFDCENMNFSPSIDTPNLSQVGNMSGMFDDASTFNADLSTWDVSNVTNMQSMFNGASSFNGNISTWNVSNVTDMTAMFFFAVDFNSDISSWNTANVQEMNSMFDRARSFNQNISGWNTSNVTDMTAMFTDAEVFNQDISNWDTGNVIDMDSMFRQAENFNQDLSTWDTSNVTDMEAMFEDATSFDQSLGTWDLSNIFEMENFLSGAGLSTANYDATLIGWATLDLGETQIPLNVIFDAGNSTYCNGENARNILTTTYGWTITDGGLDAFCGTNPFITTWNIGLNETLYINVPNGFVFDYIIDWGDGTINTGVTGSTSHVYSTSGVKTVRITGVFPAFKFFDLINNSADKLLTVEQWGDQVWESMEDAFHNCANMNFSPSIDTPDLSAVQNMEDMFLDASSFNADLSSWNVSNVTSMSDMFNGASIFNGDISTWDVSNVTDMSDMFYQAEAFNGDISSWDVGNVTDMVSMFDGAIAFNADIGNWDVSSLIDLDNMFYEALSFNQNLGDWDLTNVIDMSDMFAETGLSSENYDNTLIGWATDDTGSVDGIDDIPLNIVFNGGDSYYCNAEIARNDLETNFNWTITDNGVNPLCGTNPFTTTWSINANETLYINVPSGFTYDYVIDWGDGTIETGITGSTEHTYSTSGVKTVNISGQFPAFQFDNGANSSVEKLLTVEQWGDQVWQSMEDAFLNCENMNFSSSIDTPDLSAVQNMNSMFEDAISFNSSVNLWDVSSVTTMQNMFKNATSFDQSLENWDISSINTMESMFDGVGLSTTNYDATLIGWANLDAGETQIPSNVIFNAGNSMYCSGENARNVLSNTYSWIITDGGADPNPFCNSNPFITTWDINANETLYINVPSGFTYDYAIDWGDGTIETGITSSTEHTYSTSGIKTVNISGQFPAFQFDNGVNSSVEKLLTVEQWGDQVWQSMEDAFLNCENLNFNSGIDIPNLSAVQSMSSMFEGATNFNSNINLWNTSSVTKMNSMFKSAQNFNSDISGWVTSNVIDMSNMFENATAFNQNIESWDTQNLQDVSSMFRDALAFDQSLADWDISNITSMADILRGNSLSTSNYDDTLLGWATLDPGETQVPSNIFLNAGNSFYCDAQNVRSILINSFGWIIVDAGLDSSCSTLGIENNNLTNISLIPNPTSTISYIRGLSDIANINIYDVRGRLLKKIENYHNDQTINFEDLNNGVYFLNISSRNQSKTIRLVKN